MARATPREAQHGVSDRELVDPVAQGGDEARQVTALARREGGWEPGVQRTAPDGRLTGIDARRLDGHHDLTRTRHRHRDVGDVEHV
ncbi:MAG: hypothetical protein ABSE20_28620, partial [Acetobacteraceae bacterium]